MTVKGLFTHFNDSTKVVIYDSDIAKQKNIVSWNGNVINLKDGSRSTYNYSKVNEWYVNKNRILEIIIK